MNKERKIDRSLSIEFLAFINDIVGPIISGDKFREALVSKSRRFIFGLLNLHSHNMPITSLSFGKHFLALAESLRILCSIFLSVPITSFKIGDRNGFWPKVI